MTFGPRQKIYLTIVILVIIVIALLSFLIRPLVAKIKAVSVDFIEKNNSLASYQEKGTDYLTRLKDEYFDIEPQIPEVNKYFLESDKAVDFILAVEEIATLSSNYQEIKEAGSSAGEAEGKILFFQISLWGSFPNLIKFLARLENMEYFINVYSLQITKAAEGGRADSEKKEIIVSAGDVKSVVNIGVYVKD